MFATSATTSSLLSARSKKRGVLSLCKHINLLAREDTAVLTAAPMPSSVAHDLPRCACFAAFPQGRRCTCITASSQGGSVHALQHPHKAGGVHALQHPHKAGDGHALWHPHKAGVCMPCSILWRQHPLEAGVHALQHPHKACLSAPERPPGPCQPRWSMHMVHVHPIAHERFVHTTAACAACVEHTCCAGDFGGCAGYT
eukprot:1161507-Pelagomonas_calceolata.AAC.6